MLDDRTTVSLVMPCRNEGNHITGLLEHTPSFFDEIIVVSNASTDNTWETLCELSERMQRLVPKRDDRTVGGVGYGFAHMTGIASATSDWIVCLDADGTYPSEDAPTIIAWAREHHKSFVSCNRYPDPNIPLKLQVGVKTLCVEIRLLYGLKLSDSLSGMWVFERSIVPMLHLTEGDWNLSPQIKINAWQALGKEFCEYPIKQAERLGNTKQAYFRTGWSHLVWIARNRFAGSGNKA